MRKGIVFSYDALLFAICISVMFLSLNGFVPREEVNHFLILQKQHDLMKIWLYSGNFSEYTLGTDFEFVFPGRKGTITASGKKINLNTESDSPCKEKSSISSFYLESSEVKELTFTVCY